MTRINVVPVKELTRQHLIAEYREILRLPALVRAAQSRGATPASIKAPDAYTLGKGHVKFFYTRLSFIVRRHKLLVAEMDSRGYEAKFRELNIVGLHHWWLGDYEATNTALFLNRQRIKERLNGNDHHRQQVQV